MKKNMFLLSISFLLTCNALYCYASESPSSAVEVFYRDITRQQYQTIIFSDCKDLIAVKCDADLIALAQKWKNEGVSCGCAASLLSPIEHNPTRPSGLSKTRTSIVTKHDLSIDGGECAWLFEQLLDITLPPVTASTSKKQLAAIVETVNKRLIEIEKQPLVEEAPKETLSVSALGKEDKLKRASDSASSAATLDSLARNGDAEVQAAVANNPKTLDLTLHALGRNRDSAGPDNNYLFIRKHKAAASQATATSPSAQTPKPNDADKPTTTTKN
jgi:hypothetical protein